MIIRSLLSKKEKALSNVVGVYQSVAEHGSTCPCHGIKVSLCMKSNKNNNSVNNKVTGSSSSTTSTTLNLPIIFDFKNGIKKQYQQQQQQQQYHNQQQRLHYSVGGGLDTFKRSASSSSSSAAAADTDYAFEMATSNIRYGPGVTRDVGFDMLDLNCKNVVVFTDKNLVALGNESPVWTVCDSLKKNGVNFVVFDNVSIEPTDKSFKEAIQFVLNQERPVDGFVAVGGGSTIDTAKAANLYSTFPTENFLDYVNAPVGLAKPIPGALKPLIAIPTTAGTGSEATGVAVFDLLEMNAKTGIASRRLKPTLGLVDPNNTRTMPRNVAISSGFDQLCHALESYTALLFSNRTPRPLTPIQRPAYQGSNPISDIWSLQSLKMIHEYLPMAVEDPSNDEARSKVMLAATYAGIGFGNAGVHLCVSCTIFYLQSNQIFSLAYPVSGMVKTYRPDGYSADHPIIPHGMSVVLNAPAVFKFTASANVDRHRLCASLMGADMTNVRDEDVGLVLSDQIKKIMKRLNIPDGLSAGMSSIITIDCLILTINTMKTNYILVGFNRDDIPELVKGTLPQHRVTKLSPRPVGAEELAKLFEDSMSIY
ncbi:iron-containing alcohol dehydrogenase [Heterostelium album PN500]|uniref:hydroxyacid-oxoacid transhydrogenase n=1 Tax=Heterostelium pallidum (strain ATCC 26659 / Pp 5 / PN500) TaxID=670386 RepID=D3BN16_HETP5|nr:iron-containing alcohol dehydrogenase [Heterostelium album PN500]EFA77378.1 iron-containing alcohol dehydrogenase [Heterostelium album PN500]|eukprot:XP_020429507.1 iron-containing alcohol dehydrogenase [Heterostelium album PN500]